LDFSGQSLIGLSVYMTLGRGWEGGLLVCSWNTAQIVGLVRIKWTLTVLDWRVGLAAGSNKIEQDRRCCSKKNRIEAYYIGHQ
jgi:hypothetical protein